MRALFARPQLSDHTGPDGLLGLEETVENWGERHAGLGGGMVAVDGDCEPVAGQELNGDGSAGEGARARDTQSDPMPE